MIFRILSTTLIFLKKTHSSPAIDACRTQKRPASLLPGCGRTGRVTPLLALEEFIEEILPIFRDKNGAVVVHDQLSVEMVHLVLDDAGGKIEIALADLPALRIQARILISG